MPSGVSACSASPSSSTSLITCPSESSIILSAYCSANSRSCDTTITSFVSDNFLSVSNTCLPVAESSAPVGSSAIIISGFLTRARAIATRCFCPPDNSLGFLAPKPSKSTCFKISFISLSEARLPCSSIARAMLAPTENSSSTLYS